MKKFFLFAAAIVAAMTINAKVVDLTAVGTTIDEWTVSEATVNETESDYSKLKYVYDIKANVPGEAYLTAVPDIVYQVKNGSDKQKAFAIYPGKCYEFGGKNGILIIKNTAPGATIKLTVAAKGGTAADFNDPAEVPTFPKNAVAVSADLTLPKKDKDKAGTEGYDSEGYAWKEIEYQALGGEVQIKEFGGGYRINKIEVSAFQGIENTNATVKVEKFYRDGQLIIRKNGVEYNVLGAQL